MLGTLFSTISRIPRIPFYVNRTDVHTWMFMGTFEYASMYLYIWPLSPYGLRHAIFLRIIISNCAPRVVRHTATNFLSLQNSEVTILAMCFREPSRMNVQHYALNLKIGVLHPRAEDICISHRKRYKVVSVLGTNARRRTFGKLLFLARLLYFLLRNYPTIQASSTNSYVHSPFLFPRLNLHHDNSE